MFAIIASFGRESLMFAVIQHAFRLALVSVPLDLNNGEEDPPVEQDDATDGSAPEPLVRIELAQVGGGNRPSIVQH